MAIEVPDRLIEVTNYSWMGLDKWDEEAIQDKIRDKSVAMRSEYIRGVTSDAMLEQVRLLTEANGEAWMTEELTWRELTHWNCSTYGLVTCHTSELNG